MVSKEMPMSDSSFGLDADASGLSRRQILRSAGTGFGFLALAGLVGQNAARARAASDSSPAAPGLLAPKPPHFPAKAKRLIFLFMNGAMSQMDTFDYKPQLQKD